MNQQMFGAYIRYTVYYSTFGNEPPKVMIDENRLVGVFTDQGVAQDFCDRVNRDRHLLRGLDNREVGAAYVLQIFPESEMYWSVSFNYDLTVKSYQPVSIDGNRTERVGRSEGGAYGLTLRADNAVSAIERAVSIVDELHLAGTLQPLQSIAIF